MILLPRAADELEIPFVASGGQADGRSLVASLAMGADGINMGTRFIATKEAPVHEKVKQAIVAASELDTRLVMRPLRNTERVMTNDAVEELLRIEREKGADLKFEDIIEQVAGVYPRIMREGDMDAGAWSMRDGRGPHQRHPDLQGADRPHHGGSRSDHPRAPVRFPKCLKTRSISPARPFVVVGGTSGIGNGIARSFVERGATVHVTGTRGTADDYWGEEGSDLAGLHFQSLNLSDRDAAARMEWPDRIDVAVLCQGIVRYGRAEFERPGWDEVIAVNLSSLMDCARALRPTLADAQGSLIVVSSVGAYHGMVGNPAYAASKGGGGQPRHLSRAGLGEGRGPRERHRARPSCRRSSPPLPLTTR